VPVDDELPEVAPQKRGDANPSEGFSPGVDFMKPFHLKTLFGLKCLKISEIAVQHLHLNL
jgi:hypothetical protein